MKREVFEKSLMNPLLSWGHCTPEEVRELLGEDAAQMVGFHQKNPHHCYDLWEHTLRTAAALSSRVPARLRTAAFFHDIGKPQTARFKDGRLVYYGHAAKSAAIAAPILQALEYARDEQAEICFYIRRHDAFISWVLPQESCRHDNPFLVPATPENVRHYIRKEQQQNERIFRAGTQRIWENLLALCRADAMAQAPLVYQNGRLIDTRRHKLQKIDTIRAMILQELNSQCNRACQNQ